MKRTTLNLKAPISVLLAVLITIVWFSPIAVVSALAEPPAASLAIDNMPGLQAPVGTLTVKGDVRIAGNPAATGATVLSGSLITTGTGATAVIDMGALGRIEVEQLTEITLTMQEKNVDVELFKCGNVLLSLSSGVNGVVHVVHKKDVGVWSERREVDVHTKSGNDVLVKRDQGKEKIVKAGHHTEFDDAIDVTATGDSVFRVYCHEDHYVALWFLPLAGLLFISGEEAPPVLTTIQPQ
jgi:hypothetical protein